MIEVKGCRILVKPYKIEEHDEIIASAKAAGIAIPDFSERKEQINVDRGIVVQIGNLAHQDYVEDLKAGDVIGYAKFGGKFVKDGDQLFLVINDEDVVCVYKDE